MTKGVSINIGVNTLEAGFYKLILEPGLSLGFLKAPSNDAVKLGEIARSRKFKIRPQRSGTSKDPNFAEDQLYLDKITVETVLTEIRKYSNEKDSSFLNEGDFLLISFSGHGMKIPSLNLNGISNDGKIIPAEASWCFYDRPMLDDELLDVLSDFAKGVRIVIISDSCHSGTVIDKGLLGVLGKDIANVNLKALEKAVLRANGYKSISLSNFEKSELERTITILNHPDTIKIRKENIDKLNEMQFRERIRNSTMENLLKEGLTKDEIERFLDKIKLNELDKNLNLFASNKLMGKIIENDNKFLKGLSKIKLEDKTFESFNKELDLLLTDNLHIDEKKLEKISLIKNAKLIPEALAEAIYSDKDNKELFNGIRQKARTNIETKKSDLKAGETLIKADVIFLSACQDEETTIAGCNENNNSEYTKAIIHKWKGENGKFFEGNYDSFQDALKEYYKKPIWNDECEVGKTYQHTQNPIIKSNSETFRERETVFTI